MFLNDYINRSHLNYKNKAVIEINREMNFNPSLDSNNFLFIQFKNLIKLIKLNSKFTI